jgi:hypothetical protein
MHYITVSELAKVNTFSKTIIENIQHNPEKERTNSVALNHFWEADSCVTPQQFPKILWYSTGCNRLHWIATLVSILRQISAVHISTFYSFKVLFNIIHPSKICIPSPTKQTPWYFSPQTNYTDRATTTCWRNLLPTFADSGASSGQRGGSPTVVNLSFLDRSRYFSFKQLLIYSHKGWVDPVPNPLLLRKCGISRNVTRDFWVSSQDLWALDQSLIQELTTRAMKLPVDIRFISKTLWTCNYRSRCSRSGFQHSSRST